jgi:hypothetical protein
VKSVDGLRFEVGGWPPAKNEAKSMLATGHVHADRVLQLLRAARDAMGATAHPLFGEEQVGMEVIVVSPEPPPSDATNYLGGIGDVLEAKARRGPLEHLQELASVAAYENDKQLQDVRYSWQAGPGPRYSVRLWRRPPSAST